MFTIQQIADDLGRDRRDVASVALCLGVVIHKVGRAYALDATGLKAIKAAFKKMDKARLQLASA